MVSVIRHWFQRTFADPEAVLLCVLLFLGFTLLLVFGSMLTPVLASVVIAYFLEWWVTVLQRFKLQRLPAVLVAYLGFLGFFLAGFLLLLPRLWKQLSNLFEELPAMALKVQTAISALTQQFPGYFSDEQLASLMRSIMEDARSFGKVAVSVSLTSIPGLITWMVYLVLVPLLVFFMLKDRQKITSWLISFLPQKRKMLTQVWVEVNGQIANYVRGKVTEIVILGLATYMAFLYFDLRYAVLLASLVGLSALIPYIGSVVVTIPVILVAYLQWGWSSDFQYLLTVYAIIQILDGNLLVPLLFSEAVNLHPVAIIVATLLFGGIWGFWGIFFAIPLATIVKAVLNAWPHARVKDKLKRIKRGSAP